MHEETVQNCAFTGVLLHKCSTGKTNQTCVVFKVDSSSHGIDHRLWLLKDLLLHKGAVVACGGKIRNQGTFPTLIKKNKNNAS